MFQANRSLQIQLLAIKGRIKRSPLLPSIALKLWWQGKRALNTLRNARGQYPLNPSQDAQYYALSTANLTSSISTTLTGPHDIGHSCIASELDYTAPEFKRVFMEMIEPVGAMERKSWEFVMATLGLQKWGALGPDKKGLGIGSGCEKPLFYYARQSEMVVGTDLYLNNDSAWQHTAHSDILANPNKYAPFSYPKEKLELQHMNAMDLKFGNNHFDYIFSFSAIEHFGSRSNIEKTMQEIERVLKPGGIAAITTEFILNKDASHEEYFNLEELQRHMLDSHKMELLGPLDLRLSKQDIDHILDFDGNMNQPISIIFKCGSIIFTPLLLFFRKK